MLAPISATIRIQFLRTFQWVSVCQIPLLTFLRYPPAPFQPIATHRFVQSIGSLFLSDSSNGAKRLGGEVGGESEKTPFSSFSIWLLFLHIAFPPPPPTLQWLSPRTSMLSERLEQANHKESESEKPFLIRFRLREVPHFSSGIVERAKRDHAWKSTHARKGDTPRVAYSRVGWFSRALAFHSLYYPWGKMGDYS